MLQKTVAVKELPGAPDAKAVSGHFDQLLSSCLLPNPRINPAGFAGRAFTRLLVKKMKLETNCDEAQAASGSL